MAPRLPVAVTLTGDEILPLYLGAADYPWLTRLLDVLAMVCGRPRREVLMRLAPAEIGAPPAKLALVLEALRPAMRYQTLAALDPREVRLAACVERARCKDGRERILDAIAARFGVSSSAVVHAMFADISSEQVLSIPESMPGASDLAALANQRLVRAVLTRSSHVDVELLGNSRAVIRQARLRGLIVTIDCHMTDDSGARADSLTKLSVSGPLSLFRQTSLYGRALGELVPQLVWCERFSLGAVVPFGERRLHLTVTTGAPIFPSARPRPFDSDLERRFARELLRSAPQWRVVREPAPLDVGGTMIFPDFELVHCDDPARRFMLEIVGFWTKEYLERKLEHLRRARLANLILCIDESRACDGALLPQGAHLVKYRKNRIPIDDVLRALNP